MINSPDVTPIKLNGKFRFPIAEGDLQQPGASRKERRLAKKLEKSLSTD